MKNIWVTGWILTALMASNLFLYPADHGFAQQVVNTAESGVMSPVNVNRATIDELQLVRGIGPALAERIVDYRETNGKFESHEDLIEVRGIGEAKLARIEQQIILQ